MESPAVEELSPKQQQMLAALRDIQQNEWTLGEQAALDDFEVFRKAHPVRFRSLEDET